jgi:hypothetical protein
LANDGLEVSVIGLKIYPIKMAQVLFSNIEARIISEINIAQKRILIAVAGLITKKSLMHYSKKPVQELKSSLSLLTTK